MPVSAYMQRLRDAIGSELLMVPSVAAIIRDAEGRILLMQDANSRQWSLPAGAIELGESPEQAVGREVYEETNLRVTQATLVAALGGASFRTTYPNGDQVEYTVCVFACEVALDVLAARDGEAAAFQWAEPADVAGLLALPYPARLFEQPPIAPR
ncbi:MAG: NUDIX domain-containing protein [Bacteroidota bacterium]